MKMKVEEVEKYFDRREARVYKASEEKSCYEYRRASGQRFWTQ